MILAIDLGSTTFKAGLFDSGEACVAHSEYKLSYLRGEAGTVTLGLDHVTQAFRQIVKDVLRRAAISSTAISALSITSQAQTFCLWSEEAQTPFFSWQDTRGAVDLVSQRALFSSERMAEHTSLPALSPQICLSKVLYMRKETPSLFAQRRVVHLPEYIAWLLTGEWRLDRNLAAMSGLYSLKTNSWWDFALEATGIVCTQLPVLVDAGTVALRTDQRADSYGLPADLPVVLAGNDQTASAFGAELHKNNHTLITLGTAQVVYQMVSEKRRIPGELICGPYPAGGRYCLWADNCGGNLIDWADSIVNDSPDPERFFDIVAQTPAGSHGLRFEGDPMVGIGGWTGISTHHTRGDFARSVVEFLCRRLKAGFELLAPAESIFLAGGGASSSVWREMLGEMLGYSLVPVQTSPLDGAAKMAEDAVRACVSDSVDT